MKQFVCAALLMFCSAAYAQAWRDCVPNSIGPGGCDSIGPGGGQSIVNRPGFSGDSFD